MPGDGVFLGHRLTGSGGFVDGGEGVADGGGVAVGEPPDGGVFVAGGGVFEFGVEAANPGDGEGFGFVGGVGGFGEIEEELEGLGGVLDLDLDGVGEDGGRVVEVLDLEGIAAGEEAFGPAGAGVDREVVLGAGGEMDGFGVFDGPADAAFVGGADDFAEGEVDGAGGVGDGELDFPGAGGFVELDGGGGGVGVADGEGDGAGEGVDLDGVRRAGWRGWAGRRDYS
jgi:hypothetical protein